MTACACGAEVGRARPAATRPSLDGHREDPVAVELEEIVGGGDEPPFRPAGRSSAALEAADLSVELQLAEDGFDRCLALALEPAAVWGCEHASHKVIEAPGPSGACAAAHAGVR